MQILLKEILARCAPAAPGDYLAREAGRLNAELLDAYDAMADGNLDAVGRVVRIVCDMDRTCGFRVAAPAGRRRRSGAGKAPQSVENTQTGDGQGEVGRDARWQHERCATTARERGWTGNGAAIP